MAPRRPWDSLSPSYRERLSRKGITAKQHAAGEPIRAARGHEHTPEHPREGTKRGGPVDFPDWWDTRRALIRRVNRLKELRWGDSHKFRRNSSKNLTATGVNNNPPSNQLLRWALNATKAEWEDAASSGDERYSFLWYH